MGQEPNVTTHARTGNMARATSGLWLPRSKHPHKEGIAALLGSFRVQYIHLLLVSALIRCSKSVFVFAGTVSGIDNAFIIPQSYIHLSLYLLFTFTFFFISLLQSPFTTILGNFRTDIWTRVQIPHIEGDFYVLSSDAGRYPRFVWATALRSEYRPGSSILTLRHNHWCCVQVLLDR